MGFIALLTTLLGIGGDALARYQQKKQLEAETEAAIIRAETEAKIRFLQTAQDAEIAWDQAAVQQMEKSWKDEWFTILLSIPLILCFIPSKTVQDSVIDGFENLNKLPEWYVVALGGAIAASFGIRRIIDGISMWKRK